MSEIGVIGSDGACTHGDRCRFVHGPVRPRGAARTASEACRDHLRGRTHEEPGPMRQPRRRTQRKKNKKGPGVCISFRDEGVCDRGAACNLVHGDGGDGGDDGDGGDAQGQEAQGRPRVRSRRAPGLCVDFRDGACTRDDCRFSHDTTASAGTGSSGPARAPVVKLDEDCNNFKEGRCRMGDRCRRRHQA